MDAFVVLDLLTKLLVVGPMVVIPSFYLLFFALFFGLQFTKQNSSELFHLFYLVVRGDHVQNKPNFRNKFLLVCLCRVFDFVLIRFGRLLKCSELLGIGFVPTSRIWVPSLVVLLLLLVRVPLEVVASILVPWIVSSWAFATTFLWFVSWLELLSSPDNK